MLSDRGRLEGFPAQVATYRAQGMTWAEVAEETGRSERTCRRAADTPAYQAAVTDTTRQARRLLSQMADEAVEELRRLLRDADDSVKLRAVENALDRVNIARRHDVYHDPDEARRGLQDKLRAVTQAHDAAADRRVEGRLRALYGDPELAPDATVGDDDGGPADPQPQV